MPFSRVSRVQCTKLEVFVDKTVRGRVRTDGEGQYARRSNIKTRDFTHPFIHKSTLLSTSMSLKLAELVVTCKTLLI